MIGGILEDGGPTVRYLVDGNNVLYAARSHGPTRSIGRDVLCRLLSEWAGRHDVGQVVVVFDGPAPPGDLARQMEQPGVTVQFSGSGSADAVIEEEIARAAAPGQITVVTTDRAVQHAVRYRRGKCIDSERFLAELWAEPTPGATPAATPPEKPQRLSANDTQKWLDEFGPDLPEANDDAGMME